MSLRRLKLVSFIYASVRRHQGVSKKSDELTYQLRRHNNISAWFGAFKLVTLVNLISQFLLRTMQQISSASQIVQSL